MAKRRKTGGRRKGTPNKGTQEITQLARAMVPAALKELGRLAKHATSETARVTAIGMLIDRGYGKARQSHEVTGKNRGPIQTVDLSNLSHDQLGALETVFGPLALASDDDEGDQG